MRINLLSDSPYHNLALMQIHHPKLWDYCINTLNLRQPLDYIGIKYEAERLPILNYIEKEK